MKEVKCYSLDVIVKNPNYNDLEMFQIIRIMNDCEGIVGVNFDEKAPVQHVLFDNVENRNKAYNKLKDIDTHGDIIIAINMNVCYVDEKYLIRKVS